MLPYLFELFDPVLHMDDFELLTLLAGETRSMGDLVHRWLRKLLLVEIFLDYNEMDHVIRKQGSNDKLLSGQFYLGLPFHEYLILDF